MPLFVCENCKNIENTALSSYWYKRGKKLCSKCDTGEWHERFPEEKFNKYKHKIVNGFVEYK